MTDPIERETSLIERIRNFGFEGWRRFAIGLMLVGILLYIFGEVSANEWAVKPGIWLLLAGIASAILYSVLGYFLVFSAKD